MGYRNYIQVVNKSIVDDLRKCSTKEDLLKTVEKYSIKINKFEGSITFFPVYGLPNREEFEFGKYYDNHENMLKVTKDIFSTEELQKLVSDSDFRFGGIEVIESAINWAKQHIIQMYQNLVDCKSDWEYKQKEIDVMSPEQKKEYHYKMLLNHCRDYLDWWKPYADAFEPYNNDKTNPKLANTWLYEHTFWDLIRMWKSFDPTTEYFIYIGW